MKEEKSKKKKIGTVLVLIVLFFLLFFGLFFTVHAPRHHSARFFTGEKDSEKKKDKEPDVSVQYASYASTPDCTWKENSLDQNIVLTLPKDVTVDEKDGTKKTVENPVVAAPSLWVDFNSNGKYDKEECVFNAPAYDKKGNVKDPGQMLSPGKEIDTVILTRSIPAGTYHAMTLWTPEMKGSRTPANPMVFEWNLTVQ